MGAAFGWGALAASSLVIGALIALRFQIGLRTIEQVMGFGAGVLINAVAFDLIKRQPTSHPATAPSPSGSSPAAVFYGGDRLIDRLGGGDRKDATGDQQAAPRWPSCSAPCSTESGRW